MSNTSYSAKVRLVNGNTGNLKAYATLVINYVVAIEGFKVLESKNGQTFVVVPSHKGTDKEGNETYFNDVRFLEDVPEGEFRGQEAEAALNTILVEYGRQIAASLPQKAGRAHDSRKDPDGGRPNVPQKGGNNKRPTRDSRTDAVDW